ncbi:MAG: hypothetical protein K2Q21_07965 [Chitinophagaceae bacterium]|nr:hypothetical protein [Chitinophagaceae bacterium]
MNILFVCSRNQWRSRTAEDLYKNKSEFNCKSAGTEPSARIKINSKLLQWADIIFVMEKKHKQRLVENFESDIKNKQIVILHIEDNYNYMDSELVELLTNCVEEFLGS